MTGQEYPQADWIAALHDISLLEPDDRRGGAAILFC